MPLIDSCQESCFDTIYKISVNSTERMGEEQRKGEIRCMRGGGNWWMDLRGDWMYEGQGQLVDRFEMGYWLYEVPRQLVDRRTDRGGDFNPIENHWNLITSV